MDEIYKFDLSIVSDGIHEIRPAMLLLNIFMQKRDSLNRISIRKTELSKALGIPVRTITNWLLILSKNGLIKYKYSGSARLNPFFYYVGSAEDFRSAKREWETFRGDMGD